MYHLYARTFALLMLGALLAASSPTVEAQNLNDDWFRAFPIFRVGGANTYQFSNVGAQTDPAPWGDPASCQSNDGRNSVWASFRVDQAGPVTIDLDGSDFDTIIVLYDGFGNKIACNDDDPNNDPGDFSSRIANELVGSTSLYYVRITGWNGAAGTAQLQVTGLTGDHPHNESDEAQPIEALDVPYFNWNFNTPASPGASERAASCTSDSQKSVWYRYRPTVSAQYRFETTGTLNTVINVWDGNFSSVGTTELACDNDSGDGANARVTVAMQANRYYYVRVATLSSASPQEGQFRMIPSMVVGTSNETAAPDARLSLASVGANPFIGTTTLAYTLPAAQQLRLSIYDILGREVAVLVDGVQTAGTHEVRFDAAGLPSGMYVARIQSGRDMQTTRLTLAR